MCVYCGSSVGRRAEYAAAARALASELAARDLRLVYGGASIGLMGAVADAALDAGVEVVGVIPRGLFRREILHPGLSEVHAVDSMHERKATMFSLSDGFVALPGGLGTLDELFEILTWAQLGLHDHPVGVLDVAGFYSALSTFLDHAVEEEFVRPDRRSALLVDADPARLLDRMQAWSPIRAERPLESGGP